MDGDDSGGNGGRGGGGGHLDRASSQDAHGQATPQYCLVFFLVVAPPPT